MFPRWDVRQERGIMVWSIVDISDLYWMTILNQVFLLLFVYNCLAEAKEHYKERFSKISESDGNLYEYTIPVLPFRGEDQHYGNKFKCKYSTFSYFIMKLM